MILEEADQTEAAIGSCGCRQLGRDGPINLETCPDNAGTGQESTSGRVADQSSKDIFETTPWLLDWMAACRLPFDASKSQRYFEQAFKKFKGQKDAAGTFISWAGVVDSIFYAWEFKKFDKWFQMFEELTQGFEKYPSKEIEGKVASSMIAALVVKKPRHPEVETWMEGVL